jgi:transposase
LDNLSSHKRPALPRAIRPAAAKLFYPPSYSPDLNPIEQAFSKLKTLSRKANARSFETEAAIGAVLKTLTSTKRRNFIGEAGCRAT